MLTPIREPFRQCYSRRTLLGLIGASALATAVSTPARAGSPVGSVYYVATTGNDANPGTLEQPWRTLQKAANTLKAGDTVYVRAGTYNEAVRPANSGTPGAPITWAAYPGETVYIDGTGLPMDRGSGLFWIDGTSYLNVIGFSFIHVYSNGFALNNAHHVVLAHNRFDSDFGWYPIRTADGTDCHDLEISNNYIHRTYITTPGYYKDAASPNGWDPWAEMISIAGCWNVSVHHNTIDYNPRGEGINFKNGTHDSVAHHNLVVNTHSAGMYIGGWTMGNYNIEYYDNVVSTPAITYPPNSKSDGNSIAIANELQGVPAISGNLRVYNNLVYNSGTFGIGWYGGGVIDGVVIVNNTFSNLQYYFFGSFGGLNTTVLRNVRVRNNIFDGGQVWINTPTGYPVAEADHNGFHDTSVVVYNGVQTQPAGGEFGTANVVGDPRFVNPAQRDYHLLGRSPMIDAGSPFEAPSTDLDSVTRPQGQGFDIGAYEHHGD